MKKKIWIFFVAPPAAVLFVTLFGFIVKWLWNWLLPAIFAGAHLITFSQAIGLLILCRILFGSWSGHNGGRHRRKEKWEAMSPEEREKFRQSMRERCGNFGPAASEPPRPSAGPA